MNFLSQDHTKLGEFSLIKNFFQNKTLCRSDVLLGIGDDAALLKMPHDQLLVSSMDTLVENIHFLAKTPAYDIGYKALAVNLSDLAAMGAEPAWMMLGLTLPAADPKWLTDFSNGIFELANLHNVQLIGGDTTRGPLSITFQVNGFIPPHQALRRDGAKVGDKIYVSGTLGDAGLGLQVAMNHYELPLEDKLFTLKRLHQPTPRIDLGIRLRGLANSAIDISDGLLADIQHILNQSKVGASIYTEKLPLSDTLKKLSPNQAQRFALTSGDDYELCFTVSQHHESQLLDQLNQFDINCTCIGEINSSPQLQVIGFHDELKTLGFNHFNNLILGFNMR